MTLVVLDTPGIQSYIYKSNRLRENIGGSYIVSQATGPWALSAVPQPNNVADPYSEWPLNEKMLDPDSLDAEVLYAAGGNTVVLCRSRELAKKFVGELSRVLLRRAPGLNLVAALVDYDWSHSLATTLNAAFEKLRVTKQSWNPSRPLSGLGPTLPCRWTGAPAVGETHRIETDPGYPASAEVLAKFHSDKLAMERLRRFVDLGTIEGGEGMKYPSEFNDLGGAKGRDNYIAVVHADGNGTGQRIQSIGKPFEGASTEGDNRAYVERLRAFSKALDACGRDALKATIQRLVTAAKGQFSIKHQHDAVTKIVFHEKCVPIRPLVFGGDDVTFVCDGRLGIELARIYLEEFEKATKVREEELGGGERVTACAGVAIVKSHYPFYQAYALSEKLAARAKEFHRKLKRPDKANTVASCLDWHFTTGGLYGELNVMRDREYAVRQGSTKRLLHLRPLALNDSIANNTDYVGRSWSCFEKACTNGFQTDTWQKRRNKMKALMDALRKREAEVNAFRIHLLDGESLPNIGVLDSRSGNDSYDKCGWFEADGRCAYYDALEAAGFYMPL
jgi:hypothetical protein